MSDSVKLDASKRRKKSPYSYDFEFSKKEAITVENSTVQVRTDST